MSPTLQRKLSADDLERIATRDDLKQLGDRASRHDEDRLFSIEEIQPQAERVRTALRQLMDELARLRDIEARRPALRADPGAVLDREPSIGASISISSDGPNVTLRTFDADLVAALVSKIKEPLPGGESAWGVLLRRAESVASALTHNVEFLLWFEPKVKRGPRESSALRAVQNALALEGLDDSETSMVLHLMGLESSLLAALYRRPLIRVRRRCGTFRSARARRAFS
jgi:hypothetical protein